MLFRSRAVPPAGFEPAHPWILVPKTSASAIPPRGPKTSSTLWISQGSLLSPLPLGGTGGDRQGASGRADNEKTTAHHASLSTLYFIGLGHGLPDGFRSEERRVGNEWY